MESSRKSIMTSFLFEKFTALMEHRTLMIVYSHAYWNSQFKESDVIQYQSMTYTLWKWLCTVTTCQVEARPSREFLLQVLTGVVLAWDEAQEMMGYLRVEATEENNDDNNVEDGLCEYWEDEEGHVYTADSWERYMGNEMVVDVDEFDYDNVQEMAPWEAYYDEDIGESYANDETISSQYQDDSNAEQEMDSYQVFYANLVQELEAQDNDDTVKISGTKRRHSQAFDDDCDSDVVSLQKRPCQVNCVCH